MIKRYKEIFFGLFLGLAMWVLEALMHTVIPVRIEDRPTFAAQLFSPDVPQLVTRLVFIGFALLLGYFLWRSNQREREVRDLERRIQLLHERMGSPAILILDGCNALLRSGSLPGESLEVVKAIRVHARQVDDFLKDFPRRQEPSPEP